MRYYRAHGLRVASEIELPLPRDTVGQPSFTLRVGPRRQIPDELPPGERLAQQVSNAGDRVFYTLSREDGRTTMRYPELCEITGDGRFTDVTAHLQYGVDAELLGVLAAGTLLAVHLTLNRHLVLHASAVQLDGQALAFVGASGMGKSTLAAALCGQGAALVSDDVLRVDLGEGAPLVYPGSTEARLRQAARELADDAKPDSVRPTADGRLALRPEQLQRRPVPLAAILVPRPSKQATSVTVDRLEPARALLGLLQFPRVSGLREPGAMNTTFQGVAELVETVPVLAATIPWGPPFDPAVLDELLATVCSRL